MKNILSGYRYGRYLEDDSLDAGESQRLLEDKIREYLRQDDAEYAVDYSEHHEIQGLLLFKLSSWDTEHFGFHTSLIDHVLIKETDYDKKVLIANRLLKTYQSWCETNNIRFIVVKISSMDLPTIHGFEMNGFRFMENWIFNKYELKKLDNRSKQPLNLRLIQPSDLDDMLLFSKGAFTTHRFHADSHISKEKAETLYEKWIRTDFHDPKQRTLVYESDDRPAAFMIYYRYDLRSYFNLQFAMWKMALLDPSLKGKGLGTDFFISLLHYHKQEGLDVVDSGLSNRNLTSLNLHNKLNFKIFSTLVTLHKWI
jgi:dTDP-4-amino-4,6-dideoxy-D-galactose acyltransferase